MEKSTILRVNNLQTTKGGIILNTKKIRTRQEFTKRINPKGKNYIIGLDAGYSSMKVYYEGGHFCFPSFLRAVSKEMLTVPSSKDILYKDENGEMYIIGTTAQNMISVNDTNDTESELFGRKRYVQKSFQILCNTAIALALDDKKDNREIVVQTGLPTAYVEGDSEALKRALCKGSCFELKIGNGKWKQYRINLEKNNIYIMPQPAGSFYSAIIKQNGEYMPDAKDFLYNNTLTLDVGFGTCDFYGVKSRAIECKESIDNIGMREVLKRTSEYILKELDEDIRVPSLQKNLESGVVIHVNEEEMKTEEKELAPILEKANEEIFQKAMVKAKGVTNAFREYKYLIVGGGTGEAWLEKIKEYLSGMKTLQIIPSNRNDNLAFIYSNVRGYYLYRYVLNKYKG